MATGSSAVDASPTSTPTVGTLPGCCARATSGRATVTPARSAINSRRFISRPFSTQYRATWVSIRILSVLGNGPLKAQGYTARQAQSRTAPVNQHFADFTNAPASSRTTSKGSQCPLWVISGHRRPSVRCPLYPRKRTFTDISHMSALCQKQTKCAAAETALFDHLSAPAFCGLHFN
jgi:hypothetical protein